MISAYSRLREFWIDDEEWGPILIMRPIVREGDDPWGVLAPLKDTPWGAQIPIVSGKALSTALHGWSTPLMEELGPEPKYLWKQITPQEGTCIRAQDRSCPMASLKCSPGGNFLECYEAPGEPEVTWARIADGALVSQTPDGLKSILFEEVAF